MNSHALVIPFNESIISSLNGRELVVRLDNACDVDHVASLVEGRNRLKCILFDAGDLLDSVQFQEEWADLPIAIFATGLGSLRELAIKLPLIRKLDIRVYLPLDTQKTYTELMILSSLGIACAGSFADCAPNWETLNDLMHYAIYGKARHATIYPFHYVVQKYQPDRLIDFNRAYFEDPSGYLHVDACGRIALTNKDLRTGNYISDDLSSIDEISQLPGYTERLASWKRFFLQRDECAFCPAWRVCLGKFSNEKDKKGCKEFFLDLITAAEFMQAPNSGKKREPWQP